MKNIVLVIALFVVGNAFAQNKGDDIVIGEYDKIHSEILDEDRLLLINLPEGYDQNKIDYPVVYLFYGADSFRKTAEFLGTVSNDSTDFAMAGYPILNTLSDFGSVSRGICTADNKEFLSSIEEHVKISREDGIIISRQPDEDPRELTGNETVSMNFWCLTPVVFDYLEKYFNEFLIEKGQELKSEIYLPIVLGDMTDKGDSTVKVIKTESQWFGVTYKEDKPLVQENISTLIERGVYPTSLWKK